MRAVSALTASVRATARAKPTMIAPGAWPRIASGSSSTTAAARITPPAKCSMALPTRRPGARIVATIPPTVVAATGIRA